MSVRWGWELEGEQPVIVRRDERGVPHVRARSEADLYRGLGSCHGVDRALQVLLMRVVVAGQASEVLEASDDMLRSDRLFRRLDLGRAAAAAGEQLDDRSRRLAEAYCDGLNWALRRRRPWELRLVGYRPEPWTVADSIAISRAMGYVQIAEHQANMERLIVEMVQAGIERRRLEELFPGHLDGADLTLLQAVRLGERVVPATLQWQGVLPTAVASNNWTVAPQRSATGHALLAGDPHLEVNRLPAVWYESVLELGERFCINASIPGLPVPAVGRTNDLAWAPTYSCMDAVDSWIEDCRDGCCRRLVDGQDRWVPLSTRTETIARKGKPAVTVTFHENEHGTLDGDPVENGLRLATRWSGLDGTGALSLTSGFNMLFAADVDAGMRHLGRFESAWHWLLADTEGSIAYQMSGLMPIRRDGWSGLLPVPGWDPDNDWRGFAEPSELPRAKNPSAGYLLSANDDTNHLGVRRPINLPMGPDRGARIAELLAACDRCAVADMQRIQLDVHSRQADRFMGILRPLLPSGPDADVLRHWACDYETRSLGAALFEAFYCELLAEVFGQALGHEVMRFLAGATAVVAGFYSAFDAVLLSPRSSWFDGADRDAVYRRVAERLFASGGAPDTPPREFTMKHLMLGGRLPAWLGFDRGPIPLRGGRATASQGQVFVLNGRETSWAPSYRFITDMSESAAHTALAGGPSDRRFSRWYTSDLSDWLAGRWKRLEPFMGR